MANVWLLPLGLLFGLWLVLAFSQGGFLPRQWLLPAVATSFFALVTAVFAAYPRRPRQGALALIFFFFLYLIWVASSLIWAPSAHLAWEEVNRTLLYFLVFVLALLFLTDRGTRRICRYILVAAALALIALVVWRLQTTSDLQLLFTGKRFTYPATYPNNTAALFLMLFWPLICISADVREWVLLRGLALGAASALLGLAAMTQSRGALWAFAITMVLWFVCSPLRLRTLAFMMVPAVLMLWSFPDLNRYWVEGPEAVGAWPAVYHTLLTFVVAGVLGVVLGLLERWVHVSGRMKLLFGGIVLAALLSTAVYGAIQVSRDHGSLAQWARESWARLTAEQTVTLSGGASSNGGTTQVESRFATLSASGRWDIWRVGWEEFLKNPITGVGANNYEVSYLKYRRSQTAMPRQPHSLQIRVLSETGAVGAFFFFGFLALGLSLSVWPRAASAWRRARDTWLFPARRPPKPCRWGTDSSAHAWPFSLAFGVLYWVIHGSVEWLWHMPGVTLPALLLLALAVSIVDARAIVLWPWPWAPRGTTPVEDPAAPDPLTQDPVEYGWATAPEVESRPGRPLEPEFLSSRRSERHTARRDKRARRQQWILGGQASLNPPGRLSVAFRAALVAVALLTLLSTFFPWLALRFQHTAARNLGHDQAVSIANTAVAAALNPADPEPLALRSEVYAQAARSLEGSPADDAPAATFDNLCLAFVASLRAMERDAADWSLYYMAGRRALDLAAFSATAGARARALPPGSATGSLADDAALQEECQRLRRYSVDRLVAEAHALFSLGLRRNPLHPALARAVETTASRTEWEQSRD
jgi:hypothetical protein